MDDDGVDGILYLVAHAGGEPADGRHAAGELEFGLDLFGRFQVVQGNQRAQPLAVFIVVNKVQRSLNAPAGLSEDLFLHQGDAGVEGLAKGLAEHRGAVEDLLRMEPQNAVLFVGKKRLAASETSTARPSPVKSRIPSCRLPRIRSRFSFNAEKTSSTLRMRWPMRSILVETRAAMSWPCDLFLPRLPSRLAAVKIVELLADLLHGPERQIAEQEGHQQAPFPAQSPSA